MSDSGDYSLGASIKKRVRLPIALPLSMDEDLIALSSMTGVSKATMVRILVGEAIESRKQTGMFPGGTRPQSSPQPQSESNLAEEESDMREQANEDTGSVEAASLVAEPSF